MNINWGLVRDLVTRRRYPGDRTPLPPPPPTMVFEMLLESIEFYEGDIYGDYQGWVYVREFDDTYVWDGQQFRHENDREDL